MGNRRLSLPDRTRPLGILLLLLVLLPALGRSLPTDAAPSEATTLYLPIVHGGLATPEDLVGSYFCTDWEMGLIAGEDYITLNADGTSVYIYINNIWGQGTVYGTWSFDPYTNEVTLNEFHWPVVEYLAPNRLWKQRSQGGYDLMISCLRDTP